MYTYNMTNIDEASGWTPQRELRSRLRHNQQALGVVRVCTLGHAVPAELRKHGNNPVRNATAKSPDWHNKLTNTPCLSEENH